MEQEFKFLRISRLIFKILAWIAAVFFLIVSLIVLFGAAGADTPRAASIIFLLGGGFYFLFLFCISEVIGMLLTLSDRTSKLLNLLESKSTATPPITP